MGTYYETAPGADEDLQANLLMSFLHQKWGRAKLKLNPQYTKIYGSKSE
jgi:hypothetical protein